MQPGAGEMGHRSARIGEFIPLPKGTLWPSPAGVSSLVVMPGNATHIGESRAAGEAGTHRGLARHPRFAA
jgi:hypothetical protein